MPERWSASLTVRHADILVAQSSGLTQFSSAGVQYVIQTPAGVLYLVYVDSALDVAFRKSADGGLSWGPPTVVFGGTTAALSVWYDRWSNISAGLIHCAYTESVTDDTRYRTINTESSDALSTQTVIFAGSSTLAGAHLSITRAVGGNVYCKTVIDAGTEGGFFRLPNANVPNGAWDAARTVDETIASGDKMILAPNLTSADTQDIMAIFWDSSASEVSRKLYDDSANSWSETSIATSMTSQASSTAFPHFDMAVDIANSRLVVVAWSAVDAANADLRCWTVTDSAITEVTNVVLNSTDDQGLCAISIDLVTGDWTVFYGGKSNGSETFTASINIYAKVSTDDGSTWGPESLMTLALADIRWLITCPRRYSGPPIAAFLKNLALRQLYFNVELVEPLAQSIVGRF